jgi:hypothetical protein
MSAYLEKAPTVQLTRINAANRLFSVPLTRITSVPECAVSSVGFLWGSGTVSRRCGVSVGSPRPLAGSADRRGVPRYRGFRTPMTTFLVTQRHRCHLPGCDNSAPNDALMFVNGVGMTFFSGRRFELRWWSGPVIAGLRTRQGWAAPGGARKLLLGHAQQVR